MKPTITRSHSCPAGLHLLSDSQGIPPADKPKEKVQNQTPCGIPVTGAQNTTDSVRLCDSIRKEFHSHESQETRECIKDFASETSPLCETQHQLTAALILQGQTEHHNTGSDFPQHHMAMGDALEGSSLMPRSVENISPSNDAGLKINVSGN